MSVKIHKLSENLIQKISAGEVIDRPASVVKELVENAIDAQARHVHIEVVAGGRQSITIVDDGVGMSPEDLEACIERHSTSKLSSPSDLFAIATLGFRGEALASIGAISRMTIETRAAEALEGTRLAVEGGIRRDPVSIGRARGTTVSVRNIFFNTPARRKFLRRIETETRHITQAVVRLAVAYPQIGFRLVHEERQILDLSASNGQQGRAEEILGPMTESLLHARGDDDGMGVEAFHSLPAACTGSKAKQFLVVRGRPINSRPLSQAVYRGYGGLLPRDRHPSFVIWIELDPRKIDVNVHPTKREIRFADERRVSKAIEETVRRSLHGPESGFQSYRQHEPEDQPVTIGESPGMGIPPGQENVAHSLEVEYPKESRHHLDRISLSLREPSDFGAEELERASQEGESSINSLKKLESAAALWQLHRKYIFTPIEDGVVIIDQHVAHERIRYEEALHCFAEEGVASQQLLFPLTVNASALEMEVIREARELFERLGFGIRDFGPGTVIVDAIPSNLTDWGEGEIFNKIVNELLEEKEERDSLQEAVAASYACHTSIRAGQKLTENEMQNIIRQLLNAREPFVCPHGRPIMLKVPIKRLDRMFGRT